MDYRIINMRTDANACDCTRGCTETCKRVCTESWLWEKDPLLHWGIEPASTAWRYDAVTNWATSQYVALSTKWLTITPEFCVIMLRSMSPVRSSVYEMVDNYSRVLCDNVEIDVSSTWLCLRNGWQLLCDNVEIDVSSTWLCLRNGWQLLKSSVW